MGHFTSTSNDSMDEYHGPSVSKKGPAVVLIGAGVDKILPIPSSDKKGFCDKETRRHIRKIIDAFLEDERVHYMSTVHSKEEDARDHIFTSLNWVDQWEKSLG